jgi:hypothetical protein
VLFENEPEALYTVVSAEAGGLAVVAAASGASAEAYGFDPSEDEWCYPRGEVVRQRYSSRRGSSRGAVDLSVLESDPLTGRLRHRCCGWLGGVCLKARAVAVHLAEALLLVLPVRSHLVVVDLPEPTVHDRRGAAIPHHTQLCLSRWSLASCSLFNLWICFLIYLRIRVDSLCLNLPRETARGSDCVICFFLRGLFFFFSGAPSTTSSMNLSRGKRDGCLAVIVSWVYMSV